MTTAATEVDTRDMLVVHDAVRREWGLAPGLVRAVEAGDTRRAGVVADHLDLQAAMLHHREALARALDELLAQITEHLAAEEADALPLCASLLSPAEWHRLGQQGMAGLPRRQLPLALGTLMHGADPQVITMMLSHLPLPARIVLPRLTRLAYARYAVAVHGTATP